MPFLIFTLFLLLGDDLAVLIMLFQSNVVDGGLLDILLLRGDGESVALELSFVDLDFFLLLLVIFHALPLRIFFLVILLIDVILIIVVDFDGSLLWKWCEII
jgi:hypothetical protein